MRNTAVRNALIPFRNKPPAPSPAEGYAIQRDVFPDRGELNALLIACGERRQKRECKSSRPGAATQRLAAEIHDSWPAGLWDLCARHSDSGLSNAIPLGPAVSPVGSPTAYRPCSGPGSHALSR